MPFTWTDRFARRTHAMKSSAIREILKITEQPGVISLAGGLPAPELFPVDEIREATEQVFRDVGPKALQYSATEGLEPLREWIAQSLSNAHHSVDPDQVLVTSGSQQGLELIGKTLLDPGDTVAVESPSYLGALQAWNAYEVDYHTVATDEGGANLASLEKAMRQDIKFAYLLPNYQNPTGLTINESRRRQIAELAQHYSVPLIEDDAYRLLGFDGEPLPSLQSFAPELGIYLGSFSKVVAPGLRIGWMVAPRELMTELLKAKQACDLHTSTYSQQLIIALLHNNLLEQQLERIRSTYRRRCQTMLDALAEHLPEGSTWTEPQGGMFVWVRLPEGFDALELLKVAVEHKVAFVPGSAFYASGGDPRTLRLSFSKPNEDEILTGVARLGEVMRRFNPAEASATTTPYRAVRDSA